MEYGYDDLLDGQATRPGILTQARYATQHNGVVVPVAWKPTPELGRDSYSNNNVFRYTPTAAGQHNGAQAGDLKRPRPEREQPWCSDIPPRGDDWDYIVEVWPGSEDDDGEGLKSLAEHIYQVNAAFERKNLDYHLAVRQPISRQDFELFGLCRRYILPRQYRDSERCRLQFLQIFNCDRPYNKSFKGYRYKMSVSYESRNPLPTSAYNTHDAIQKIAFNPLNPNGDPTLIPSSSPTPSTSSPPPSTPTNRDLSPLAFDEAKTGVQRSTQPRMKPIPKPQRKITKNADGKFICTWHECESPAKEFSRKCEWSKHMDKHERPYKCLAAGCENLPGFTYSGGLLRHEREVHRKHGGPKNPLNCPHPGCKRHKDSTFARLENLNEHLRRCHTPNGIELASTSDERDAQSSSKTVRTPATSSSSVALSPSGLDMMDSPRAGVNNKKRKAEDDDDDELWEENKRLRLENQELRRLRSENQELKRKVEAGYHHQTAMMDEIDRLEKELLLRQQQQQSLDEPGLLH